MLYMEDKLTSNGMTEPISDTFWLCTLSSDHCHAIINYLI